MGEELGEEELQTGMLIVSRVSQQVCHFHQTHFRLRYLGGCIERIWRDWVEDWLGK